MNELQLTTHKALNTTLYSARDLHKFLEVNTRFFDWIKRRVDEYDFVEDQDFVLIDEKDLYSNLSISRRPRKEVFITSSMAKELSMLENNAKGKAARKYFIEVEEQMLNIHKVDSAPRKNLYTEEDFDRCPTLKAAHILDGVAELLLKWTDKEKAARIGNQAALSLTGVNLLDSQDVLTRSDRHRTNNRLLSQESYVTPTQLGRLCDIQISAHKVNKMLETWGYQYRHSLEYVKRGKKSEAFEWRGTRYAKEHSLYVLKEYESDHKHDIQHMCWTTRLVPMLNKHLKKERNRG